MKKLIPFIVIICTTLFACLALSSCSSEEVTTLYVYNWGEYISDGSEDTLDTNKAFEEYYYEKTGKKVSVNYSTFSSNESMYAKIESGSASYDVIIPSDYMIQRMVNEKMLAPLDLSKIPNYQYIDEKFKGDNVYYEDDSDNVYSVPYFYGMIGIIYNTDIVSEEDAALESWSLMWNENYTRDILQFNNSRDAFGTALYWLGYDVNEATEEQWKEARDLLIEQKALVQGYVMDEIFNKMSSGSAAIASYYAGDFMSMYEDNDALAFYYPKEGTNSYIDAMCIPKSSKNYDLAHEYINFMCEEEIAVANAEYTYYASPLTTVVNNAGYIETMSEVHPDAFEILYGEKANSVKSQAYLNLSADNLVLLNSLWEELKVENTIGNGIYVCCAVILSTIVVLTVVHTVKKRRRAKYYTEQPK
ncbi:MAG: spermidine/putrescine ABC transporter substrate-binding protein [Ruminococcaceae bacterium]|nr:spermidine/putrescine ABC transporter substrate-binding protein [Oscillospiraceae bacterium]